MSAEQLPLPGLEVPDPHPSDSAMVRAAKLTLAELRRSGRVTGRHAVQVELVLALAQAIDRGTRSGRASAVAMASKELRETMLVLDPPDENNPELRDRLAEFMRTVELAANNGGQP